MGGIKVIQNESVSELQLVLEGIGGTVPNPKKSLVIDIAGKGISKTDITSTGRAYLIL